MKNILIGTAVGAFTLLSFSVWTLADRIEKLENKITVLEDNKAVQVGNKLNSFLEELKNDR